MPCQCLNLWKRDIYLFVLSFILKMLTLIKIVNFMYIFMGQEQYLVETFMYYYTELCVIHLYL